jgi:peroxiredoxin Q/BCP
MLDKDIEEKVKLAVGDKAPDFTAKIQSGEEVTLSKILAGGQKVLLVFYPGDDTPGCTKQLCGIRDVYKEYTDQRVKVLGINHGNAISHQKFISKYNYQFGIVVDEKKEIINQYGATKLFFKNKTVKRGVFLINTDGKIEYIFWGQQDNEKILSMLKNKEL